MRNAIVVTNVKFCQKCFGKTNQERINQIVQEGSKDYSEDENEAKSGQRDYSEIYPVTLRTPKELLFLKIGKED